MQHKTHSFLVLDLCLDVLDGVGWLDLQGDGLARKCFDENLHFYIEVKKKEENRKVEKEEEGACVPEIERSVWEEGARATWGIVQHMHCIRCMSA